MPSYSAEAVVLRKADFGEADQILTLLTRYHGKVSAVAKGVRRVDSRKGGNLDLLNHVKTFLAEGKNLDLITEVELLSAWPKLKSDLEKVALAYQVAELANEFLVEGQENREVYDLILTTLREIEAGSKPEQALTIFKVKLLPALGFQPQLDHCVRCGRELPPDGLALSPELGGVVGPEERAEDAFAWGVSTDALKVWRFFLKEPVEVGLKLKITPTVAQEVSSSLQYYLEYLLERELKSPQLLKDVKNLTPH